MTNLEPRYGPDFELNLVLPPPMPAGEQRAWAAKLPDRAAVDALVLGNRRFAAQRAKAFKAIRGSSALTCEDYYQYAILGLHRAAKTFDATRGVAFITYAVHWINQTMGKAHDDYGRVVRVPINRTRAGWGETMQTFHPGYDHGELAEVRTWPHAVSLDALRGRDADDRTVGDVILLDERTPDEPLLEADSAARLRQALGCLKDRERDVVCRSFGIGCDPTTLGEIGKTYGLTRERIRQVKNEALCKLRNHFRARRVTMAAF